MSLNRHRPLHPGYHLAPARRSHARYTDLSPGHYQTTIDKNRKARSHIRQLEALGYTVPSPKPPNSTHPVTGGNPSRLRRRCRVPS